jgi:hypothetical protein
MLERKKWHKSITAETVMEAVERSSRSLDNPGFCLACGAEIEGVEPDACGYDCEACGQPQVYGAEGLLLFIGG